MSDIKTDEPLCVVAITKSGKGLEARTIVFANPEDAKGVADWLSRNDIPNTRMSVRAYEMLLAARYEREQQIERAKAKQTDKSDLFGDHREQVAWCPFCRKDHPGGAICMGHYP